MGIRLLEGQNTFGMRGIHQSEFVAYDSERYRHVLLKGCGEIRHIWPTAMASKFFGWGAKEGGLHGALQQPL